MVSLISLPIYWFVLTPLVLFLIFVPGYVVVAYVKQKISKKQTSSSTTSRLINKSRVTSYYTSIRPILRDRLQRRSSLNVPTPTKLAPTTKHLRSASTQLPSSPVKSLFQSPSRHHRRSSADSGNYTSTSTAASSPIIIPHSIRPDLLEPPYALYQIQPQAGDIELQQPYTTNNKIQLDESHSHKHYFERDSLQFTKEKDSDENYIMNANKKGKKGTPGSTYNNNKSEMKDKEKPKKSRHLISPSNHSPFIMKKKNSSNSNSKTQKQHCKIDMPPENGGESP